MEQNVRIAAVEKAREDAATMLAAQVTDQSPETEVTDSQLIVVSRNVGSETTVSETTSGSDKDNLSEAEKKKLEEDLDLVFGPGAAALLDAGNQILNEDLGDLQVGIQGSDLTSPQTHSRGTTRHRESGKSPGNSPSPSRPRLSSGLGLHDTGGDKEVESPGQVEENGGNLGKNQCEGIASVKNSCSAGGNSESGGTQKGS